MAFISFYLRWRILFNRLCVLCCLFNFYSFVGVLRILPSFFMDIETHNHKSNRWTTFSFSFLLFFNTFLFLFFLVVVRRDKWFQGFANWPRDWNVKLGKNQYKENETSTFLSHSVFEVVFIELSCNILVLYNKISNILEQFTWWLHSQHAEHIQKKKEKNRLKAMKMKYDTWILNIRPHNQHYLTRRNPNKHFFRDHIWLSSICFSMQHFSFCCKTVRSLLVVLHSRSFFLKKRAL